MAEKGDGVADLRGMTDAELAQELDDTYRAQFNLRMRHATRQLTNNQELRKVRKRIARIKTLQAERKLGITRG